MMAKTAMIAVRKYPITPSIGIPNNIGPVVIVITNDELINSAQRTNVYNVLSN